MRERRMMSRPTQRRRAGFTLIEVMVAVSIMTVGAMGIMALQQAATRGNIEAREMTMATQLTRQWIERVRTDAVRWNGTSLPTSLATTSYLKQLPNAGGTTNWFTPTPLATSGESYAFDYFGRDATTAAQQKHYCTNLRMTWLVMGATARIEARTFWHRRSNGTSATLGDARLFPNCGAGGGEAAVTTELAAPASRLRAVNVATVVRWQPIAP